MQTLDWQEEQERRATEIRGILDQTLALAQTAGMAEWVNDSWMYRGDEHTLIYTPNSDQMSIFSNDHAWELNWHEDLFLPEANTQITDAQLESFRELGDWLNVQEAPLLPVTSDSSNALSTAAQLFEQYAARGKIAFQTSADSPQHFYRIEVDETVYCIGRDDATGTYSLQRENHQPLSAFDDQLWAEIDQWMGRSDRPHTQLPDTLLEAPYWEQQALWANQILPQVEYVIAFQEIQGNLVFDPDESVYLTRSGDYQICYSLAADTLWIEQDNECILSVHHFNEHHGSQGWQWSLSNLHDLGELEAADVHWFETLSHWLHLKAEQTGQAPDWEASFNRLWQHFSLSSIAQTGVLDADQSRGYDLDR